MAVFTMGSVKILSPGSLTKTKVIEFLFLTLLYTMASLQRILEVRYAYKSSEPGWIVAGWTLPAMVTIFWMVLVVAALDYLLNRCGLNIAIASGAFLTYLGSLWLRMESLKALGRWRSIHAEVRPHQAVVTVGPYRYIRHPIYLAMALEILALPLVANSIAAMMLALVGYMPILAFRAYKEEQAMLAAIGLPYSHYRKTTPAILPIPLIFRRGHRP